MPSLDHSAFREAIVLAAGKSTRIAPIAAGLPKPLMPVEGVSILVRNLRWLRGQGVGRVWINLHHQPQAIRDAMGDGSELGLEVIYVDEPKILGTAGAVQNIASRWTKTAMVVYGDNLIQTDLAPLLAGHQRARAAVTVALFDRRLHPHTGIAGGRVELDGRGRILAFREGAGDEVSPMVNAGIYLVEPEAVSLIPSGVFFDFGHDLFPAMLAAGRLIHGELITGYCLGLDTPESYREALRLIAEGRVKL